MDIRNWRRDYLHSRKRTHGEIKIVVVAVASVASCLFVSLPLCHHSSGISDGEDSRWLVEETQERRVTKLRYSVKITDAFRPPRSLSLALSTFDFRINEWTYSLARLPNSPKKVKVRILACVKRRDNPEKHPRRCEVSTCVLHLGINIFQVLTSRGNTAMNILFKWWSK